MYTITEFRNKTKEVLDKAQKGEKITIIRGPERYILRHESSPPEMAQIVQRLDLIEAQLKTQFNTISQPPLQPEMMESAEAPRLLEKPCCIGNKRCAHWVWSDQGWYINSLSGRELESIM